MDIDYSHLIIFAGIGWIAGNIYRAIKSHLVMLYWERHMNKAPKTSPNYAGGYDSDIYYESESPIGDRLAKEMGL